MTETVFVYECRCVRSLNAKAIAAAYDEGWEHFADFGTFTYLRRTVNPPLPPRDLITNVTER